MGRVELRRGGALLVAVLVVATLAACRDDACEGLGPRIEVTIELNDASSTRFLVIGGIFHGGVDGGEDRGTLLERDSDGGPAEAFTVTDGKAVITLIFDGPGTLDLDVAAYETPDAMEKGRVVGFKEKEDIQIPDNACKREKLTLEPANSEDVGDATPDLADAGPIDT